MTSPDRTLRPRIKTTEETTEAFRSLWRDVQSAAGRGVEQDTLFAALVKVGRENYQQLVDKVKEAPTP